MRCSIGFTIRTPTTVNTALRTKVAAMVVSTASCSFSIFRAPKYWPMTTAAPMENPLKKNTSMFTITVVEPMAASACLLTKLPTMTESTVL